MEKDAEDRFQALASEIRAGDDDDPRARERIMETLRSGTWRDERGAEPARESSGGRLWNWLTRPHPVSVSPLGWAAIALLVVVLSAGWLRRPVPGTFRGRPRTPGRLTEQAAANGPQAALAPKWATQFVVLAPAAARVAVVGDFNNWDPTGTPLERSGREGRWTATLWLPAGVYSYNYVVDGRLQHAADEPGVRDEFGGGHSIIIVGEGSI